MVLGLVILLAGCSNSKDSLIEDAKNNYDTVQKVVHDVEYEEKFFKAVESVDRTKDVIGYSVENGIIVTKKEVDSEKYPTNQDYYDFMRKDTGIDDTQYWNLGSSAYGLLLCDVPDVIIYVEHTREDGTVIARSAFNIDGEVEFEELK